MNENNTQNITQDNVTVNQAKPNGLGVAGMVIGIVSILLSCIVFGGYIGIVGLILSIIAVVQKNKKKGMAIAGIVLNAVAIIIMAVVLASANAVSDSLNDAISSSVTPTDSDAKTTESDSQPSPDDNTSDSAEEETAGKCHVGDVWANKYISVSFDECGEYVSDNQFIRPADGNKFIYATFTFENVGSSDTTIAYWDFDCYADGYACEATYGADDSGFSQSLSAGRKISGSVYFEVPESATEIEIEFSPNLWTSEKVVFIYQ